MTETYHLKRLVYLVCNIDNVGFILWIQKTGQQSIMSQNLKSVFQVISLILYNWVIVLQKISICVNDRSVSSIKYKNN